VDHIGGLVAGGRRNFPNAEVYADRRDVAHWTDPAKRAAAPDFLKSSFDARPSWSASTRSCRPPTASADLARRLARGPHRAHAGADRRPRRGRRAEPAHGLRHALPRRPPRAADTGFLFEQDRAAAQAMRARFFPRAAEEKALLAATHMPFPGLGGSCPTAELAMGVGRVGIPGLNVAPVGAGRREGVSPVGAFGQTRRPP
jgi:hypothetical protein